MAHRVNFNVYRYGKTVHWNFSSALPTSDTNQRIHFLMQHWTRKIFKTEKIKVFKSFFTIGGEFPTVKAIGYRRFFYRPHRALRRGYTAVLKSGVKFSSYENVLPLGGVGVHVETKLRLFKKRIDKIKLLRLGENKKLLRTSYERYNIVPVAGGIAASEQSRRLFFIESNSQFAQKYNLGARLREEAHFSDEFNSADENSDFQITSTAPVANQSAPDSYDESSSSDYSVSESSTESESSLSDTDSDDDVTGRQKKKIIQIAEGASNFSASPVFEWNVDLDLFLNVFSFYSFTLLQKKEKSSTAAAYRPILQYTLETASTLTSMKISATGVASRSLYKFMLSQFWMVHFARVYRHWVKSGNTLKAEQNGRLMRRVLAQLIVIKKVTFFVSLFCKRLVLNQTFNKKSYLFLAGPCAMLNFIASSIIFLAESRSFPSDTSILLAPSASSEAFDRANLVKNFRALTRSDGFVGFIALHRVLRSAPLRRVLRAAAFGIFQNTVQHSTSGSSAAFSKKAVTSFAASYTTALLLCNALNEDYTNLPRVTSKLTRWARCFKKSVASIFKGFLLSCSISGIPHLENISLMNTKFLSPKNLRAVFDEIEIFRSGTSRGFEGRLEEGESMVPVYEKSVLFVDDIVAVLQLSSPTDAAGLAHFDIKNSNAQKTSKLKSRKKIREEALRNAFNRFKNYPSVISDLYSEVQNAEDFFERALNEIHDDWEPLEVWVNDVPFSLEVIGELLDSLGRNFSFAARSSRVFNRRGRPLAPYVEATSVNKRLELFVDLLRAVFYFFTKGKNNRLFYKKLQDQPLISFAFPFVNNTSYFLNSFYPYVHSTSKFAYKGTFKFFSNVFIQVSSRLMLAGGYSKQQLWFQDSLFFFKAKETQTLNPRDANFFSKFHESNIFFALRFDGSGRRVPDYLYSESALGNSYTHYIWENYYTSSIDPNVILGRISYPYWAPTALLMMPQVAAKDHAAASRFVMTRDFFIAKLNDKLGRKAGLSFNNTPVTQEQLPFVYGRNLTFQATGASRFLSLLASSRWAARFLPKKITKISTSLRGHSTGDNFFDPKIFNNLKLLYPFLFSEKSTSALVVHRPVKFNSWEVFNYLAVNVDGAKTAKRKAFKRFEINLLPGAVAPKKELRSADSGDYWLRSKLSDFIDYSRFGAVTPYGEFIGQGFEHRFMLMNLSLSFFKVFGIYYNIFYYPISRIFTGDSFMQELAANAIDFLRTRITRQERSMIWLNEFILIFYASLYLKTTDRLVTFMANRFRDEHKWGRPWYFMLTLMRSFSIKMFNITGFRLGFHGKFAGRERAYRFYVLLGDNNPCLRNSYLTGSYTTKQCLSKDGIVHIHLWMTYF